MILEFNQVERQPDPRFEGRIKDKLVIKGKGSCRKSDAFISYENRFIEISSQPHKEIVNGKKVTQVLDIMENNERIGYIYPTLVQTKKILFISSGYGYYVYSYKGNEYKVYEVGLGKNQHYFCVYDDVETIAIIHKSDLKINLCDHYTIYSYKQEDLVMLSLLTLYFDCVLSPDFGTMDESYKFNRSFETIQKELNDKYDPTFIPKIKLMEK